jgi:hypothetical protein
LLDCFGFSRFVALALVRMLLAILAVVFDFLCDCVLFVHHVSNIESAILFVFVFFFQ